MAAIKNKKDELLTTISTWLTLKRSWFAVRVVFSYPGENFIDARETKTRCCAWNE